MVKVSFGLLVINYLIHLTSSEKKTPLVQLSITIDWKKFKFNEITN
jgi:hypothetical protein